VMHKPGGTSTLLRERGFDETMRAEFPGVRIVARQFGMADPAKARAAAENMMTAHPELDGIFASSEASSLGSMQAIAARGRSGKTKLVTFDTSDSHVEALKNGTIDVMLVQDSFRMGREAVRTLVVKLEGGQPESRLDIPARIIRKQDLSSDEVQSLLKPKLG
jgi:ribose transport system substrate-binding protein